MHKTHLKKIKSLAEQAREWSEYTARKHGFHYDLNGFCGIAAANLFLLLKREGYFVKLAVSEEHAFVVWKEYIIDVTASQFSHPNICIKKIKEVDEVHESYWTIDQTYNTFVEFVEEQKQWPHEQRAKNYEKHFLTNSSKGEQNGNLKLLSFK